MRHLLLLALALVLSACSGIHRPVPREPAGTTAPGAASTWFAPPLPHEGNAGSLNEWWAQWIDRDLAHWLALAQTRSASLATARAQMLEARATLASTESAAGPQLAAVADASRGRSSITPLGTLVDAGVQASWALDIWGQNAAAVRQAQARNGSATAAWHEARVLVAADTARLVHALRFCRSQLAITMADNASRRTAAQSTERTYLAGLAASDTVALVNASVSEGQGRLARQARQCEHQVKALVALTGETEPAVRQRLEATEASGLAPDLSRYPSVAAVPAEVIRQRPDVAKAQLNLVAAAEGVGVARAALLPSLNLSGSWLRNRFSTSGGDSTFNTWSAGPLTLRLPLIGRGGLNAAAQAAQAQYEAAGIAYAATLRSAVAEVEQSLVTLDSLRREQTAARDSVASFARSFQATETRYRVGFASIKELEEARRLKLQADGSALALQLDQVNAWIGLYVALGGGFDPQRVTAPPPPQT